MGEFPKFEKREATLEQRYRQALEKVSQMLERGASEQERIDAIAQWQDKERELDELGKDKPESKGKPRERKAEIRFALCIAEVKVAAGFKEEAYDDFYDAIDEAAGCHEDDLAEDIRKRMRDLYPE